MLLLIPRHSLNSLIHCPNTLRHNRKCCLDLPLSHHPLNMSLSLHPLSLSLSCLPLSLSPAPSLHWVKLSLSLLLLKLSLCILPHNLSPNLLWLNHLPSLLPLSHIPIHTVIVNTHNHQQCHTFGNVERLSKLDTPLISEGAPSETFTNSQ
jgi:hypothetical protein